MIGPRWFVPALTGVLIWIACPQGVSAHAELLGSEPRAGETLAEPPERVQLWFTEPVVAGFTEAALLDERGRRLDQGPTRLDAGDTAAIIPTIPELGPGVYTVSWRALSAVDGHIDRGVVVFAVGDQSGVNAELTAAPWSRQELWLGALVRWAGYLGAVLLAGTAAFHVALPWAPRGAGTQRAGLSDRARRSLRLMVSVAAGALMASVLGDLTLHSIASAGAGDLGSLASAAEGLIIRTRFGAIWLGRIVLAASIAWLLRDELRSSPERPDRWGAAVFLGALLLFTFSAMSHAAAATSSGWLGISASWLHLALAAVWVGGLVNLALAGDLDSRMAARFSGVAGLAVLVMAVAGLLQGLILVGAGSALLETDYGRALLLKLTAVAGALTLAYANRRAVQQWWRRRGSSHSLAQPGPGRAGAVWRLRGELILAGLALGVTAMLAGLPPAWQAYQQLTRGRPLEVEALLDGRTWLLRLDPGRPGLNTLSLQPPTAMAFSAVRVLLTSAEADIPSTSVTLVPTETGTWVEAVQLGMAGRWLAEVVVRRPGDGDTLVRFPLELPGAATALPPPPILSGGASSATTIVAVGLVVLGLGLTLFVLRTTGAATWEGRGLLAASATIVVLGAYVALRPTPSAAVLALNARAAANPVAPSNDSVARGELLYRDLCAACHGDSGGGDGARVTARGERLADLRVHLTAEHQDGDLYYWITRGISGTDMPAFGETLSELDRWHLVNYLRTL